MLVTVYLKIGYLLVFFCIFVAHNHILKLSKSKNGSNLICATQLPTRLSPFQTIGGCLSSFVGCADFSPPDISPPDLSPPIVAYIFWVIIISCKIILQRVIARLLNINSVFQPTAQLCRVPRERYSSAIYCSTEAVSQSKLSEFLFLYKSDPIIVPFNVFEQFFLKQLGVSSIKELIDNID